jgi:solute carrier family 35 protein C2
MEPIVTSHRRRKSSLMGSVGQSPVTAGRPRSQSLRTPQYPRSPVASSSLVEEPKIAEEEGFIHSPTPSKYGNDSDSYSDDDVRDDEETGLTRKEKKRKEKKRRRNTLLDQRIAKDKGSPTDPEQADGGIVMRIAINVGLILLWYSFSLCISLVSQRPERPVCDRALTTCSTTSGCSTRTDSISPSRYSRRQCTWWCNFA